MFLSLSPLSLLYTGHGVKVGMALSPAERVADWSFLDGGG